MLPADQEPSIDEKTNAEDNKEKPSEETDEKKDT